MKRFFDSIILPEGVEFEFNGVRVLHRETFRTVEGVRLASPLFDPKTETVKSQRVATSVDLVSKFGEEPMVYEMGIPVDKAPWSLPYDINVGQKTPLDSDRNMLPDKYKAQLIAELVGPLSDLYAEFTREQGEVPPEIADKPENITRLSESAKTVVIEEHFKTRRELIVRRNPLDDDDVSESQELEDMGYLPVNRRLLAKGLGALLEDSPTVHRIHEERCEVHGESSVNFPDETHRQRACLRVFEEIASVLVGCPVRCERMRSRDVEGAWGDGKIDLNIDTSFLWDEPLGEKALGVIVHECSHATASGHCGAFERESARLGARLAIWVAQNPERWTHFLQILGHTEFPGSLERGGGAL